MAPALLSAQVAGSVSANVSAGGAASTTLSVAVTTRAKTKADTEIDRRIKALTEVNARVGQMTKVTADFKQNLDTYIRGQITALSSLKAKIDADTDSATLRADVQSVTQNYRIFALIMPQARIAAAADREATIINMFAGVGTKLQARIQAAGAAGADTSALVASLTDMGAKLTSAQTHAQAAVNGSATLAPDQGDKTKMKANTDALQAARKEIESARQDLLAARKEVDDIVKGLHAASTASASSTVTTQ
jgi:DNA repair ATPase RecN